jgi:SNF2 family DNA or RNA helicase
LATRNDRWRTEVGGCASLYNYTANTFRYRHIITKAQQNELPDESGGGILADEMGMGKSLTTLVLIEKTLSDALQWAEERKTQSDDMMVKQHCRATLVIVPSHGKWFHTVSQRAEVQN